MDLPLKGKKGKTPSPICRLAYLLSPEALFNTYVYAYYNNMSHTGLLSPIKSLLVGQESCGLSAG